MRGLFSIDELMRIRTNGFVCDDCDRVWYRVVNGFYAPLEEQVQGCRHPKLVPAVVKAEDI